MDPLLSRLCENGEPRPLPILTRIPFSKPDVFCPHASRRAPACSGFPAGDALITQVGLLLSRCAPLTVGADTGSSECLPDAMAGPTPPLLLPASRQDHLDRGDQNARRSPGKRQNPLLTCRCRVRSRCGTNRGRGSGRGPGVCTGLGTSGFDSRQLPLSKRKLAMLNGLTQSWIRVVHGGLVETKGTWGPPPIPPVAPSEGKSVDLRVSRRLLWGGEVPPIRCTTS